MQQPINKSNRLNNLSYAIRGPVFEKAQQLEAMGQKIINLNIGNPAPFGFDVPDEIIYDMIMNIRNAQGYSHHLGIFPARKAIMHYTQQIGIHGVTIDDIFIGNGVSELIVMTMQALLNEGDEILLPSPDYPLWTTSVALSGGKPVHYICDEESDWNPDLDDIRRKINRKTKGIVVINPNNPTGAVYSKEVLEGIVKLAAEHNLIIFSDEIYDKILYDGNKHVPIATLSDDVFIMTYGGLSKNYRAAGFRGGWVILSGAVQKAKSFVEGFNLLASMRLCANVPTQYAIQTALGGYQSINDLVAPEGRLCKQRDLIHYKITDIPGITCVKPKGALYLFPKIDLRKFSFKDDEQFVFDLLSEQKVLVVSGTGFNYVKNDHFRIVFLPSAEELETASNRIRFFLDGHRIRVDEMEMA
ncbi:pyridoxal phosphate-dependent aminotransferase [Emticicia sp. C21]|uniref:pyridoxal phosphate-dependent aminotransferase n=1 Tax=Emticicia sp. C21 TaxID=2302915 RepID=UPI000E345CDD|nr:pyridoxal phosphate-dependent aminotransferase [Emticicia sp. C21]RFS18096.1 pyridoxal phosphate-dependent aminotransferase [Emticicia sp. C21]